MATIGRKARRLPASKEPRPFRRVPLMRGLSNVSDGPLICIEGLAAYWFCIGSALIDQFPATAATGANFGGFLIVLLWELLGDQHMIEVVVAVYKSASAAEVAIEDLKVARVPSATLR